MALLAREHISETELSRPRAHRPGHLLVPTTARYISRRSHVPITYMDEYVRDEDSTAKNEAARRRSLVRSVAVAVAALLREGRESTHKKETGYRIKAIPLAR